MAPPNNYNLPVVFENLRDPESLHQLIDSLEALDRVSEDVFKGITDRCAEHVAQLGGLKSRLTVAESKITAISGRCPPARGAALCHPAAPPPLRAPPPPPGRSTGGERKADSRAARRSHATKVFSPSKYPAPDTLGDFSAVNHGGGTARKLKRGNFSLPPISAEEEEKERCTQEDSSLFETSANAPTDSKLDLAIEGLGVVPSRLNSVGSILLFNSNINPYKKYSAFDNLDVNPTLREMEKDELHTAPTSVATGEGYEGMGKSDISYQPGAAPLSQLNLVSSAIPPPDCHGPVSAIPPPICHGPLDVVRCRSLMYVPVVARPRRSACLARRSPPAQP